jgi:hypothetical protein
VQKMAAGRSRGSGGFWSTLLCSLTGARSKAAFTPQAFDVLSFHVSKTRLIHDFGCNTGCLPKNYELEWQMATPLRGQSAFCREGAENAEI